MSRFRLPGIDLVVEGELTWPERVALSEELEESLLPIKVDVVELALVDREFRERVDPPPTLPPELRS